jgi:hypothetical protein
LNKELTKESLGRALKLLAGRLDLAQTEAVRLVVCGGSAMIATGLRQRTTHDTDVVALMNAAGELVSPAPLPPFLLEAAARWAMTHDVSEGFRWVLQELLKEMGYESAAKNI